jgi:tetratricopeptide (TPR) repeat protein
MDVMSEEEAVAALLSAAIPKPKKPTMDEVAMSVRIVEELGYLPVAIIQAGSFIRQRKCFPDYIHRLRANRLKLLRTPATAQRDKHSHSVYATLETTKLALPDHVLQLLHLLSYYHHSHILVNGMTLAAERAFYHQTFNFLERPLSFEQSISLLKEIFWDQGEWDPEELDDDLLLLQQYSLVTTVRNDDKLILRLHPLTQAWARDTLEVGKTKLYEEAAVRILMCCTSYLMECDHQSFVLQVNSLRQSITHVNDRAVLAYSHTFSSPLQAITLWNSVMSDVSIHFPNDHENIAEILYWMGMAHERAGRHKEALKLNERAVGIFTRLLGPQHPRTLKAMTQTAWTYIEIERVNEAEVLLDQVIKMGKQTLREDSDILTSAMHCLGQVYSRQERLTEAERLQTDLLKLLTNHEGLKHPVTLAAMTNLAATLFRQGHHKKALAMEQTILKLKQEVYGTEHPSVATTMFNFACLKYSLGDLEEANLLAIKSRDIRGKVLGEEHEFYKAAVELCDAIATAMVTKTAGDDSREMEQMLLQSRSLISSTRETLPQASLEPAEEPIVRDEQPSSNKFFYPQSQIASPQPWVNQSRLQRQQQYRTGAYQSPPVRPEVGPINQQPQERPYFYQTPQGAYVRPFVGGYVPPPQERIYFSPVAQPAYVEPFVGRPASQPPQERPFFHLEYQRIPTSASPRNNQQMSFDLSHTVSSANAWPPTPWTESRTSLAQPWVDSDTQLRKELLNIPNVQQPQERPWMDKDDSTRPPESGSHPNGRPVSKFLSLFKRK